MIDFVTYSINILTIVSIIYIYIKKFFNLRLRSYFSGKKFEIDKKNDRIVILHFFIFLVINITLFSNLIINNKHITTNLILMLIMNLLFLYIGLNITKNNNDNNKRNFLTISDQKKIQLFEAIEKNINKTKLIYNNLLDENIIDEIEFNEFLVNLKSNQLKLNFTCSELHYFMKKLNNEYYINFPYNLCNIFLNKKGEVFKIKSVSNNSDKLNNDSKNKIDKIFIYED
ncbi:hypothetical protein OBK29_07170 [Empedobacter falsenii]|uniref:hypothetical protein n=1 Tax=Empedobacter falsenii TaxID=343874 RepID=UPI003A8057C2